MPLFYADENRFENLILGLIHIRVINIHFPDLDSKKKSLRSIKTTPLVEKMNGCARMTYNLFPQI